MQIRHIALVPEMGMDASELARVSAALQKQVTRDLSPVWEISATVDLFPRLEDLPAGYWPIVLTYRELGTDAGVHIDERGQPFALVELSPSWSLTASHLCLEMLSDPYGNRTLAGLSPRADQGEVEFLTDICDPCVHPQFAYVVNDVLMSDFCVPEFWEVSSRRERYSFTGAIRTPLEILPSGQLRWYDPRSASWWTRRLDGNAFCDLNLGRIDAKSATAREFLDARTPQHLLATKMSSAAFEERMALRHEQAFQAARSRACGLRASFGNLPGMQTVDFAAAVQAVRSAAERPGRPKVFGALLRASLGAAIAERAAAAPEAGASFSTGVAASGFAEPGAFVDPIEEVTTVEPEELTTVVPAPAPNAAAPQAATPAAQVEKPAETAPPTVQRSVPPPLPQTPPAAAPHAFQPAPAPMAAKVPTADSLSPIAPVRAPAPTPSPDRTVAIVAIAAAVVLGIALSRNSTPQASSPAAAAARASESALATPSDPPRTNPTVAPAASAPSAQPVGSSTTLVEPAATTARRTPARAKTSVTPAAARREAETPERAGQDALDNLIDERR